ncbi:tetratricopeptide repeat protein [Pseudoxanthomonas yeongjuensis]|uniref:tetratricopeptide repeat protein n=1 Tax=Pseudoxanthomonas yeongjuensis TaxID=377616 RepID=UPI001B87C63B|nr:tetratricopeptide repeat protein [Pseudoxanthomonas yeongjuensis]
MTLQRLVLAAALALAAFAAQAQTLTKPKEFYFDEDRNTARLIVAVAGEGEPLAEQLVKQIERNRNRVESTAQLAHVAIGQGRIELGEKLYQEALTSTEGRGTLGRAVRWNYGWDLYRLDKKPAALAQWTELANGFGSPSWVPPTLALVLWDLDRKAEAVQWYAASVRTEPSQWSDPANFPALLPGWSDPERKRLAEVFAAWQADPPAWP